jgi:type VI secretion system secreted protein VgrG
VVSAGDIVSRASEGAMNLLSKNDATLASTSENANLFGRKSVIVNAAEQDVFVLGKTSISLLCGESSIVLLADGTIRIKGKTGVFEFSDTLDQTGRNKILLNC